MIVNYFKLLNVPEKLVLDHNELKKNYFNLLKECSNDPVLDPKHVKETDQKQKSLIEEAYNTLRDRLSRIEHLLKIQGLDVANDNKPPRNFEDVAEKVLPLLESVRNHHDESLVLELKKWHKDVMTHFSSISIELAKLERAWDEKSKDEQEILKRLRRKSAAFSFIRNLDQDIRSLTAS